MELMGTFLQKNVIPQNAAYNLLISANDDYYDIEVEADIMPNLQKGDKIYLRMDKNHEVTTIEILERMQEA